MTEYVCGFLFSEKTHSVALIEKQRPDWQKGKLNGIGGHIEPSDDNPHCAMEREFEEETGVKGNNWNLFVIISGPNYKVYFFKAFGTIFNINTMTDENVYIIDLQSTRFVPLQNKIFCGGHEFKILYNLSWLIPLALDPDLDNQVITIINKP